MTTDRQPRTERDAALDALIGRCLAGALVGACAGAVLGASGSSGRLLLAMLLGAYAGVAAGAGLSVLMIPRLRTAAVDRAGRAIEPGRRPARRGEPDVVLADPDVAAARSAAST